MRPNIYSFGLFPLISIKAYQLLMSDSMPNLALFVNV